MKKLKTNDICCYSTEKKVILLKKKQSSNAFDEAAKKLEHIHFSTMLKLNVGGQLYPTTLATLNNDPGI